VCAHQQPDLLPPDAPRNLLAEVLPPDRIEELEETGELNMGVPHSGRGALSRQRHAPARLHCGGDPFHRGEMPPLAHLSAAPVLGDLIMEKRGLILMVGATGSGKSTTLASMIDHRNDLHVRPHPDHRRPDRVPVQEQEVRRQPARDRHRHRSRCKWP
jgi:twitching motility protein PilU